MTERLAGSFRDPAGFVYLSDNILYRRIDAPGREGYERLMQSGLYDVLVRDGLLVAHEDLGPQADQPGAWTVIRPERVPMVWYPYEWSFSQLRDAALLMLRVERRALDHGLSLKDASAYNVQFLRGRPVLIDTLSFEARRPGPWGAYRQFCQHFYAPLLLAATANPRLSRLSLVFIDGVPLGLASQLLPRRTWFQPGPLMHLHLHAKAETRWGQTRGQTPGLTPSEAGPNTGQIPGKAGVRALGQGRGQTRGLTPLIESLQRSIEGLRWEPRSRWSSSYADQPSYDQAAFDRKREVVARWLERLAPATVWDLGANTGQFSILAAEHGATTVAFDADPACVDVMYREVRSAGRERLLPLVSDLANPSPAIGWANTERQTIEQRGPADLVMALALVHHLAIGNNVPLRSVADYFARIGRRAIVEFVPATDAMARQMMAGRETIFAGYTRDAFEHAFGAWFTIDEQVTLSPSDRVLYLLTTR